MSERIFLILLIGWGAVFLYFGLKIDAPFENNLRIALAIADGNINVLFQHSVSQLLWLAGVLVIVGKIAIRRNPQWGWKKSI
jgi:TctA family transporter